MPRSGEKFAGIYTISSLKHSWKKTSTPLLGQKKIQPPLGGQKNPSTPPPPGLTYMRNLYFRVHARVHFRVHADVHYLNEVPFVY